MPKISILIFLIFSPITLFGQQDSIVKNKGWKTNEKTTIAQNYEALVVINDIFLRQSVLQELDANQIESMTVLKNDKAVEKYGNQAKNGAIVVVTKNISKNLLHDLYLLHALEYKPNTKGKEKKITGKITDCENNPINEVIILNINSRKIVVTDSLGNYTIKVRKNDVLQISKMGLEGIKVIIKKQKVIDFSLKEVAAPEGVIYRKPVIYLYPTEKTAISVKFDFKGKLLTTFPKYDNEWQVIAEPNGQIFDTKTQRYYSSLFWDGTIDFEPNHYQYTDGFVVQKDSLSQFLIEKLEHIGLNNTETNEFVQFWLPILEQNEYNFMHFYVNEACNQISINNINPKLDTTIRVYMEYYGLEEYTTIKAQILPKTQRKGFTLVEWGGADVSKSITKLITAD